MKKIFLIFVLMFFIPVFVYASSFDYTWSTIEPTMEVSNDLLKENSDDKSNPLKLDCGSCILIEQKTGKVLYSYNSHEKLAPASVTKLMSIYLIMEAISAGKINYDTLIPCSENAASMGGSQIWLDTTENLSVSDMLKAICVVSANDCVFQFRQEIFDINFDAINFASSFFSHFLLASAILKLARKKFYKLIFS